MEATRSRFQVWGACVALVILLLLAHLVYAFVVDAGHCNLPVDRSDCDGMINASACWLAFQQDDDPNRARLVAACKTHQVTRSMVGLAFLMMTLVIAVLYYRLKERTDQLLELMAASEQSFDEN
jgi:hypothetical protein